MSSSFSHLNSSGDVHMVDVGYKDASRRLARAEGWVLLPAEVLIELNKVQFITGKGSVIEIAKIAGIMAAKRTSDWIPLCHPVGLDQMEVELNIENQGIYITATARCHGKTGVEMEALTAVSAAALTVYDMCKALSHDISISNVRLLEKRGGKKDFQR
jgi:cyclic pyranopterin phosphate synthase